MSGVVGARLLALAVVGVFVVCVYLRVVVAGEV